MGRLTLKKRVAFLVLFTFFMVLVPLVLERIAAPGQYVQVPLHSTIEAFGSVASIMMGFLLFLDRGAKSGLTVEPLAAGFVAMGILHAFHGVIELGQGFVLLFSLGSLVGSIGFLSALLPRRYFEKANPRSFLSTVGVFNLAIGFLVLLIADEIPAMAVNGDFSSLANGINILSGVFFLTACGFLVVRHLTTMNMQTVLIVSIAFLFGVSGITFYFSQLWSTVWWYWHVVRVLAFLIMFVTSVFEVKRLQETLQDQVQEISRINERLENYSYTISHDLKEPIRSIRTFSEFIQEDYSNEFDDEGKDYLARIIKASTRMARMIDDLLSLSRIGRVDTTYKATDIGGIVAEVSDVLASAIADKRVTLDVDPLPVAYCQETWIKSVFLNLISNAIKYNDSDRPVVRISYQEQKGFHEFTVADNGQGIESDQIGNVFKLFRKAHQDRNSEGSGAGLTITQTIVEHHKGTIWIEKSDPGRGTEIKFTLSKEFG